MKKYRLIKAYPGSPSLGTIALDIGIRYNYVNEGGCFNYESNKKLIETNPEFWEKVVEKEYEIISYMGNITLTLYTLTKEGDYKNSALAHTFMPEIFETDAYKIHSIKRLSDGVVFTVGDKIDGPCGKNQEIVRIDTEWIYYHNEKHSTFTYRLSDIKKAKKPLFTTMDGVEIFEGDKIWRINGLWQVLDHISADNLHARWAEDWFSSKKAAEHYILMNKPCMSVNDIINNTEDAISRTTSKLMLIAKSKL